MDTQESDVVLIESRDDHLRCFIAFFSFGQRPVNWSEMDAADQIPQRGDRSRNHISPTLIDGQ